MAEPEELILEGAHFATRVARDVWRRYGTPVPDTTIPLASVRVRLEMFLSALFRTPVPVTRASRESQLAGAGGSMRDGPPSRRRTAVVRHGRTARLFAAGAAVDRGRAGR